ncbi:MAG: hypothetical protein IT210_22740 [Armatimonadetes bacterium]|nr:hypothetical protein [Armatimonadota bacterium]
MLNTIAARWMSAWGRTEEDAYDCPAFDRQVRASKASTVYQMHSYWTKKPYEAVREYIAHYTRPGDVVLDPFCGSGGTGLAALSLGRAAILGDLSPAAVFIARHYTSAIDPAAFRKAFHRVAEAARPAIEPLYETACSRCGGRAAIASTTWSSREPCRACSRPAGCASCAAATGKESARCGSAVPVEVYTRCERCALPSRRPLSAQDRERILRIEAEAVPYAYPRLDFPDGEKTRELFSKGVRRVEDIFTRRNLHALAALKAAIEAVGEEMRDAMLFVFSASLHSAAKTQRCRAGGGGALSATYYLPPLSLERNVWDVFERKFRHILRGQEEIGLLLRNAPPEREGIPPVCLLNRSAADLPGIPDGSIDYIFTDPAYSDQVQFGELNFLWEAWLGMDIGWQQGEIVVNRARGMDEESYRAGLRQAFAEMARVLRPGRWLTLTFHDTKTRIWEMIQDLVEESGLAADFSPDAAVLDPLQKSFNQTQTHKVARRDLVLSFRKPRPAESTPLPKRLARRRQRLVSAIAEFLYRFPDKRIDQIYDHAVARLVLEGDMHAFDLKAVLEEEDIFVETGGEWRLRGQPVRESLIETDPEKEAIRFLEAEMARGPRSYGDLLEAYNTGLPAKPAKEMAALLEENFAAAEGEWRIPTPEEREALLRQHLEESSREATRLLRDLAAACLKREGRPLADARLLESLLSAGPEATAHLLYPHLKRHLSLPGSAEVGEVLLHLIERVPPRPGKDAASILRERLAGDRRFCRCGPRHFGLSAWGDREKLRHLSDELAAAADTGDRERLEEAAESLRAASLSPETRHILETIVLPEARIKAMGG